MPILSPRLGIKKPSGNESVSRSGFNENYDIIDANAARKLDLDALSAAAVLIGADDNDVNLVRALIQPIDKRSVTLAYTNGALTGVTEKDGATTVKTTTLAYDGTGKLTTVTIAAGGKTIVITMGYTGADLTSVTKAVTP
jgi:YD repeat-containing protein